MDSAALGQELIDAYGSSLFWIYFLMLLTSLVSYVLYLGFYRIVKHIDHGQAFIFSDLFYFFKAASIGKALGLAVTYVFISVLATLLCFLPILYAIVPLMFLLPVFAYNPDLSISEIVKVSFALGNKKWGITFLTLILNGILLYVIALVTCGLGMLFVSCFIYLPQYIIYKKVIGFDEPKLDIQSTDL
jgi:hypothetical protein